MPVIETNTEPTAKNRINILVMGLDKRPTESSECTRADTFFVMSLDSFSGRASILSFPRDLYIDIPDGNGGTYKQRINTTTVFGCLNDYPGGGPGLAKDTLALNFGVPVNYYAIIDLEGFQEFDRFPRWYQRQCARVRRGKLASLREGATAHGRHSCAHVLRLRPDGDFKRIERQQLVMMATAKKALGLGLLEDPLGTYGQYKNTVVTNCRRHGRRGSGCGPGHRPRQREDVLAGVLSPHRRCRMPDGVSRSQHPKAHRCSSRFGTSFARLSSRPSRRSARPKGPAGITRVPARLVLSTHSPGSHPDG